MAATETDSRLHEVPILKQGDVLIASVQASLTDQQLLALQDRLAREVGRGRIRGVVLDVTVLDVMDSFAVRVLRSMAEVVKLRGAITVIVGIQPDVAVAMVRLGLTLKGVFTALDLDEGLIMLSRLKKDHREIWRPHSRSRIRRAS